MYVQNKWWKKGIALVLSGLLCTMGLSGCGETTWEEFPTASEPLVIQQSGEPTELTVGVVDLTEERREVLEEIAEKYMADDPNVQIEFTTYQNEDELKVAAQAGEVQVVEVEKRAMNDWVDENLLLDLRASGEVDLTDWDDYTTLNVPAKAVLDAMGQGHAYLLPCEISQPLLVYRKDWIAEYNADKEWQDTVSFESWESTAVALEAVESIGHSGEILVSLYVKDGKSSTTLLPQTVLWSDLGTGALLDAGAGYFSTRSVTDEDGNVEEIATIFEGEAAKVSLENSTTLEARSDYNTDEQTEWTFCNGDAAALITDRTHLESILAQLGEDNVGIQGLPVGRSGAAVTELLDYTGWGIANVASTADERSLAFDFLTFLCSADNNTHYARELETLPIHTTAEDLDGTLVEGVLATEMEMISQSGTYRYAGSAPMFESLADEIDTQFGAYYYKDEIDTEELLQACDELCKKAFEKNGQKFGVKPE